MQLPQTPLLTEAFRLAAESVARPDDLRRAVLLILDYLERLRREAERADDSVQHAADTSIADLDAAKVAKAGDTMTGPLTLPGDPTDPNHAARKAYVDAVAAAEGAAGAPYALIVDEKASGTPGGTLTAGSYQVRDLNTIRHDDIGVTLNNNQITLPAGTYYVRASAPAWSCDQHRVRLWNVTAGSVLLVGTSEFIQDNNSSVTRSIVTGRFTLASSATIRLEHRAVSSKATDGLGIAAGFGDPETYSVVELWKVA